MRSLIVRCYPETEMKYNVIKKVKLSLAYVSKNLQKCFTISEGTVKHILNNFHLMMKMSLNYFENWQQFTNKRQFNRHVQSH